ncbi:HD domain-containing protein [Candidatus Woesearchaeota archaeon]|nr:HD domain-containing protein [Candidatus Woesearchaeota archaeon]
MMVSVEEFDALKGQRNHIYNHCFRVKKYSAKICEKLGLESNFKGDVEKAAFYHDIGKMEWSEGILNEFYKFGPKDFEKIIKHPVEGYDILKKYFGEASWLEYVLYHHEKLDGSGYPKGLMGDGIVFGARIIGVADSYDAMFRHYHRRTKKEALGELKKNSGILFDKKVVEAFIEIAK